MLFTLKKIISALLMPLSIGLILFFIGLMLLLARKHIKAKFYLSIGFIWMLIIGYSPFSNAIIKPLENIYPSYTKVEKSVKYVVVLGSGHVSNDEMSAVSQLSKTALSRLSEGIRIYKELNNAKLILSGYEGKDTIAHALVLKEAAISLGVPSKDIITQEAAKDTQEEAELVKQRLKNQKFVLVTSAFHMPRSMKIFQNEKLNPIAAPTDFLSKSSGDYLLEPSAKEIKKTEAAMHEYIGILWHIALQQIKIYLN